MSVVFPAARWWTIRELYVFEWLARDDRSLMLFLRLIQGKWEDEDMSDKRKKKSEQKIT